MKFLISLFALMAFAAPSFAADFVLARPSSGGINCSKIQGIVATGDSHWMDARGVPITVAFEADVGGALTTLTVAVQHCFTKFVTNTCVDYAWLDNDGVSSNVLDGKSGARRGFSFSSSTGFLRFTIGGVATGTGELVACAS